MNFTLIKIGPSDDEDYPEYNRLCDPHPSPYVKTDSFTVLPPLSPQIPGPPATPNPYRILPPIVSRKRPSFVIIQELGSRSPSRDPSPSGRVSPFRGCGFRPSSREHSREHSPDRDEEEKNRSRSRLPIAKHPARKVSKSVSPVGNKSSAIPRPLNRRISYSPNRAKEILSEMNAKTRTQLKPPLQSSENLTPAKYVAKQKPPLPQKPKKDGLQKTGDKKPTPVVSPIKVPSKPLPKKTLSPAKKPPPRPKPVLQSPDKNKLNSSKSKENLAPSKIPSPVKSPLKSPKKFVKPVKPKTVVEQTKPENPTQPSETVSTPNENLNETSESKTNVLKSTAMKNIRKKALTTNILLSATKKAKKELLEKKPSEMDLKKDEEKKDLPHTDTSKSLPISVGSSNMTESSATLIRTTTEPALAPVEPDLITEIRSAMHEMKKEEEICVKEEKKNVMTNVVSDLKSTVEVVEKAETVVKEKVDELKTIESELKLDVKKLVSRESELKNFFPEMEIENSPKLIKETNEKSSPQLSKQTQIKDSPHPQPVHVMAVTKIEEPQSQEITNVGKIKQKPDNEVSSANNATSENRNGMSKSSWLNEKSETDMKKPIFQKSSKEHPSRENLVKNVEPPSRWKRFIRCPKCFKKSEKSVQISTITKGSDVQKLPKNACFRKYFCCFCYKCKLKNKKTTKVEQSKETRKCCPWRCFSCKNSFRNIFNKISCKKKKRSMDLAKSVKSMKSVKSDSGVACVGPRNSGCCARTKTGFFKCFGMLCCLNTAFCLRMNGYCKKIGCCKCMCCKEKKEISETERRKSTISAPKKKKWTRMFTDFPKLDASFVEHASVMRGSIPVLPVPLAWICLILNVFLPGFGTLSSGIFCLLVGKPRFSVNDSIISRIGAFLVNLLVAGSQLFTVLFCLVGWGWSVWWGVIMLKMAKKNKRIVMAEQAANLSHVAPVVDQNHDTERGNG